MKWLRVAALGLAVGLCLLMAAPAGFAEDGTPPVPPKPLMVGPGGLPGGWLGGWWERVVEWLGWGGDEGGPRSMVAADGSCVDPSGAPRPCPTGGVPVGPGTQDDEGSCVDPSGHRTPCAP